MDQRKERMDDLALELFQDARDGLVLSLRFLDRALYRWSWEVEETGSLGTDTVDVFFQSQHVLRKFKEEKNSLSRDLLHMAFHCLLAHPFLAEGKHRRSWDLACDMAAEAVLMQFQLGMCTTRRDLAQRLVLDDWKKKGFQQTAVLFYQELVKHPPEEEVLQRWEALFFRDEHGYWPAHVEKGQVEEWKQIRQQVKTDLETYSKSLASKSDGLMQNLRQVHRDRVDYATFLRKFAVMYEEMTVNDDEFDYVFYTYGMKLYGNMPLVEPLEYAEEVRIKDFVIALDTSGSCSGELIQAFLSKTYSILQSTGSFFRKVNIHIVMCDDRIQQVTRISSTEEFESYLKDLKIIGLGGTDFRPVFAYVDQLVESGTLEHLKGLIYFTDGFGRFPAQKPDYDTAFVFLEEEKEPVVPPWAIKITLGEQELRV
jgi:predicted metal-dependent peptidase